MTDLIDDKLKDICKLLVERRFTIVSEVSDDLICGICKDILVNASQTVCGCLFCEKCIDKYVGYNAVGCPGKTEECKSSSLSNIMVDHRRNLKISRLIVRCNKEDCHFECKLMEMKSHLEDCSTETIECPFMIVGCEKERLSSDKMNEHLQRESLNHNKQLLDMVNNLRNEIRELRENDEKRKCEIENLKEKITLNETELRILKEKEETNKTVIERCENEFDLLHENMEKNKDELKILREFREEIKLEIATVLTPLKNQETQNEKWKIDLEDVKDQLKNFRDIFTFRIEEIKDAQDIEEVKETVERHIKETGNLKNYALEIGKKVDFLTSNSGEIGRDEFKHLRVRVDRLNDYLDMEDGDFLWLTGIIDNLRNSTYSEHFCLTSNSYQLGLKLDNVNNDIIIRLLVYNINDNDDYDWPFRANVTIRIVHKFCRSKYLSVSNNCSINQPRNKRYYQTFPFIFPKSDLHNIGIPTNESVCVVDCDINFL